MGLWYYSVRVWGVLPCVFWVVWVSWVYDLLGLLPSVDPRLGAGGARLRGLGFRV